MKALKLSGEVLFDRQNSTIFENGQVGRPELRKNWLSKFLNVLSDLTVGTKPPVLIVLNGFVSAVFVINQGLNFAFSRC